MSQLMHEIAGTFRLCIATGFSVCVLVGACDLHGHVTGKIAKADLALKSKAEAEKRGEAALNFLQRY